MDWLPWCTLWNFCFCSVWAERVMSTEVTLYNVDSDLIMASVAGAALIHPWLVCPGEHQGQVAQSGGSVPPRQSLNVSGVLLSKIQQLSYVNCIIQGDPSRPMVIMATAITRANICKFYLSIVFPEYGSWNFRTVDSTGQIEDWSNVYIQGGVLTRSLWCCVKQNLCIWLWKFFYQFRIYVCNVRTKCIVSLI